MAPLLRTETEVSLPVNNSRWASLRRNNDSAASRRSSIMRRFHRRNISKSNREPLSSKRNSKNSAVENESAKESRSSNDENTKNEDLSDKRTVYFNLPLPPEAKDDDGSPKVHYARNKIRTSKYTPFTFIPKNLYYQFHNIANLYFLFIIILGAFSIFGAANPGLNATPLIFILFVTAVKDGIEDWRRTNLDEEINNSPVHRLVGYNNVNTADEHISLWRRIKKATSHSIVSIRSLWKKRKASKNQSGSNMSNTSLDGSRPSIETRRSMTLHENISVDGIGRSDEIPMKRVAHSNEKRDHIESLAHDGSSPPRLPSKSSSSSPSPSSSPFNARKDSLINPNRKSSGNVRFKKDYWKHVQVGDYLRLFNGEEIPADVIILATSDAEGQCYIETKNLDGETNLKVRQALRCGLNDLQHARDCEQAEFTIESEGPQPNLYSFTGVIQWKQYDPQNPEATPEDKLAPITIDNFLPRGSTVRNTEWVLGVALFTGSETKIMLNSGMTPTKRARISKELNWNVIYNFMILFCMCLVAGIIQGTNFAKGDNSLDYFEPYPFSSSAAVNGFVTFWAALILVQNLVPISLYITLEIIRTLQAVLIYADIHMYYEKIDYPCTPKSWNISDDLGQIEYIFSDKTGTLTQNVMEFKKATVNGLPYGEAYTEALAGMQKRKGVDIEKEAVEAKQQISEDKKVMLKELRTIYDNPYLHDDNLTFVSPDFVSDLNGQSGDEQKAANENMMLALALCHTVISEKTPGDQPSIEFKAQSPDEAALVATARDCGFTLLGRQHDRTILNIQGEDIQYTVLAILEFNSTRKRMSAIIRMPDGRIKLICKGADNVIYQRLQPGQQKEMRNKTAEHLEMFAREGLRTLCIAERYLPNDEFESWYIKHKEAASALVNRDQKLDALAEELEKNLTLIGGTAIEDKLQDGVPNAIQLLGDAGIKLWVLTGDKVETAINIGFSCNLLNNDMDLIVLKTDDDESVEQMEAQLDRYLAEFGMTGSDEELKAAQNDHQPPPPTHAVVIDGQALKLALDETLRQKFLLLCKQCRAVLCCRVSPSQKAAVVEMVKKGLDCLTLAIGDGANDVAMIQEAHVGVGIAGLEGAQAVMSSDYAIGQFRYLTRLLLVHGRWSYRRLAETIANFFYKNLVWTFALFWYQIYANFDCSYLYDYTYIVMFNLAFTSLPVILMGVLDQDVSDQVSLANPQLYKRGIERKEWTQPKFWLYMMDGVFQSVFVFWFAYWLCGPGTLAASNGLQIDRLDRVGVFVASGAVFIVNIYVLFNTYRWDWLTLTINVVSTLLFFFWTGVWTSSTNAQFFYKAAAECFSQGSFWLLTLLAFIWCLWPRFSFKSGQKIFFPLEVDNIRIQVKHGEYAYLENHKGDLFPPTLAKIKSQRPHGSSTVHGRTDSEAQINVPQTAQTNQTITSYGRLSTEQHQPQMTENNHNRLSAISNNSQGGNPRLSTNIDRLSVSPRPSMERTRSSFDRARQSMDRMRPSFEASDHITSAAMLTRMSSSGSGQGPSLTQSNPKYNPTRGRGNTIGEGEEGDH